LKAGVDASVDEEYRPIQIMFVVGILLALLVGAGAFIPLVSQK